MIKNFVIKKCMVTIKNTLPNYNDEDLEKIQYGLESLYLSLSKIIVILLISILLGIFTETIILILLFNILRLTGFGLHASKSWICWVTSIPTFIGGPLLCKYLDIPLNILVFIAITSIISYLLFAPADTAKRPLIRKKKRLIYKILTVIIGCIYLVFIVKANDTFFRNAIALSMIIETIIICPLTYKLFKLPYNNYKNYKG